MRIFGRVVVLVALLALVGGAVFYLHPLWVADQQVRFKLWREGLKSEYVQVPAGRLHYYVAGEGTPLLLIHGLGARGEDWGALIPALAAKGFRVYVPDLLGYGRSEKPKADYSMAFEEQVVVEFMQAMKLDHADVGGWSMGGWVAMQVALDHPERVDKLVVYDSAGIRYVPDFTQELFTPSTAAGVEMLQAKLFPKPRKLPDFVMRDLLRKIHDATPIVHNSLADMMSGTELLDVRLGKMSRPMLIVWGEEDRLIPLAVGRDMQRLTPGSVLETVPGCGHMAPSDCPEPVLADTVAFLKAR